RMRYGAEPLGYHATVWLLHAACVWAVFLLARRLMPHATAVLGASLFAVFPLHPECVGWIAGRNDILAGLFCALAAAVWLDAVRGISDSAPAGGGRGGSRDPRREGPGAPEERTGAI